MLRLTYIQNYTHTLIQTCTCTLIHTLALILRQMHLCSELMVMSFSYPQECKVCLNIYNQDNIRPRVLPCGHFFCCVCVKSLLKEGSLDCPICRSQHTIPDITQIPIAYDFEELLSNINVASPEESEEPEPQEDDAGDSIRLRRMRSSLCSGTSGCTQMLSQLCTYDTTLGNLIKEHEEQVTNLTELIRSHKNAQQLLREEKGKVTHLQREGEQQHNSLRAAAEALNEEMDTDRAISHAEQCHGATIEWIKQCNDKFPNVNAIQQSAKVSLMVIHKDVRVSGLCGFKQGCVCVCSICGYL